MAIVFIFLSIKTVFIQEEVVERRPSCWMQKLSGRKMHHLFAFVMDDALVASTKCSVMKSKVTFNCVAKGQNRENVGVVMNAGCLK